MSGSLYIFTLVYNPPSNKRRLTRRGSSVKADLYLTRPQVRMGAHGKYDVITVFVTSFQVAVHTAFFVTFHAAPLPKMHGFRATLAEHCTSVPAFV